MGGFILFFAFLAFNGGSVLHITHPCDGETMARAMVNTIVMGSAGSISALFFGRTFSCEAAINGALAGMVAACAGCDQLDMWASVVIGIFAAGNFILLSWIILKFKVDDPTSAIAVHSAGGIVGELAVPIFSFKYGLVYFGNSQGALQNLGWQFIGLFTVVVWCAVLVGALCFILRLAGILRVPVEAELKGDQTFLFDALISIFSRHGCIHSS
jgi:ammonium transporter, Amt family